MKKVKALMTTAGDYGKKETGDEFFVTDQVADQLEAQGTVEVVGSASGDDTPEAVAEKNQQAEGKEKVGGIKFEDKTSKEKKNITQPATPQKKTAK